MKRLIFVLCVAFFGVTGLNSVFAEEIVVDNLTRNYITYIPENLGAKRPLMISLHGMNQDANYQKSMLKIESIADTAKFAVVFPNGIDNAWDISGSRDINFVSALIEEMAAKYDIDRNRVYLSGFSMGGMFTYHAMNNMADKIAAFAPLSGYPMWGGNFTSSRPVPLIHVHSMGDDVCVYSGVQAIIDGWVARNNCPSTPRKTTPYKGASDITYITYGPGDEGVEVVLIEWQGGGHWIRNFDNGVKTAEEIWLFCSRYALNMTDPRVKITSPANGTNFNVFGGDGSADAIRLSATAYDPDGYVASVAFYDGDQLLTTLTSAPYEYVWEHASAGQHQVRAVATDDEGRTDTYSVTIDINAPQEKFSITSNFTDGAMMPSGWQTFDGAEKRTGPSGHYPSGCRLLRFVGNPRDFDFGLFVRNLSGRPRQGYARYAASDGDTRLTLYPGIYELSFLAANWNCPQFSDVECLIERSDDGAVVAGYEMTPSVNIGNSSTRPFSGTASASFNFVIEEKGDYVISFYTAASEGADFVLAEASLSQSNDALSEIRARFYAKLQEARSVLENSGHEIYRGSVYDALEAVIAEYRMFTSEVADEYLQAIDVLSEAIQAMLDHKARVDETEKIVIVYESNFAASGAGTLPHGWVVYDGSEKRVGELTGLGMGCRILQMTGTPRDFDYALYIRNIDGRADEGFAKFGSAEGDSALTLTVGKHHIRYVVCNWNRSAYGPIRFRMIRNADGAVICSQTVTPVCNIGNNAGNAFRGSTVVTLDFEIERAGNYTLEFYTEDSGWADAIIADISVTKSEYNTSGILPLVSSEEKEISAVRYYDLSGRELRKPASGLGLKSIIYTDGSRRTEKVWSR